MGLFEQDVVIEEGVNPHRVIRASAGAGKTYQLTTRYLLLLRAEQKPDEILATTFTRKAAGEILGRVLGKLAKALVDDEARRELSVELEREAFYEALRRPIDEGECLELLRRLVSSIHRLSISTLDSFFQRIASSFRLEIGYPSDAIMADERGVIATRLRWDAIEAMLGGATGNEEDLKTMLRLLKELHHDSLKQTVTGAIDEIVLGMYELYQEAPEKRLWSQIVVEGKLDESELRAAMNRLEGMEGELARTKAGKVNANWLKSWQREVEAAKQGNWDEFVSKGLGSAVLKEEEKFSRAEIEGEVRDVYEVLIDHAKGVMLERHKKQTESTYRMLHDFDVYYRRLRDQRSVVLFNDVTMRLAGYLDGAEHGVLEEIYFRLDGQVKHVLLDEFQDTSRSQWSVLEPMAEEVSAHAEGWGERSLFCVGDTKQAIYGWRGGCARLFDEVERLPGIDGEKSLRRLDSSYRSSQVVLDAVNDVFDGVGDAELLSEDVEKVMAGVLMGRMYGQHQAAKRALGGYVRLESSLVAVENEDSGDEVDEVVGHVGFVAERVKELAEQHEGVSIGVLVSRNDTVNRVLFELKKLGVEASGEGGGVITDEPAVGAVLNAMRLADHPGDEAAVYGVVNGPMGELLGLKSVKDKEGIGRVGRMIREELLRDGYAKLVGKWARALSGWCDAGAVKRLSQLVEVAESYEREGMGGAGGEGLLRPGRFVSYAESARLSETSNAMVRVMTVHQSKGLEFDVVVLGELDQAFRCQWPAVAARDESGRIVAVYRTGDEAIRAMCEPLREAYEVKCAEQWLEELCKLYVAMTRAKHGLYMIVKGAGLTKGGKLRSRGSSYGALLVERLKASDVEEEGAGGQVFYEHGNVDWYVNDGEAKKEDGDEANQNEECVGSIDKLEAGKVLDVLGAVFGKGDEEGEGGVERMWTTVSPSSLEGAGSVMAGDVLSIEKQESGGRLFGSLIHEWFSLFGFWGDEPVVGDVGKVESFELTSEADAVDSLLVEVGVNAVQGLTDDEVKERIGPFKAMLKREGVQRTLRRRDGGDGDELWRERNFAVRIEGGKLMRGAFDRVVVHKNCGQVVGATLIDYKTDKYEGEVGLKEKVDVYRPQVEAYRVAICKLLRLREEQVEVKLLFVGSGEVVSI
ncbi:UvrD-helicase domain-containing protein [Planctomycetota bacterium]|nr:UvrD-helicase domain-containing protein [Planctomycetota bacterium]